MMDRSMEMILSAFGVPLSPMVRAGVALFFIALVWIVTHIVMVYVLWGMVRRRNERRPGKFMTMLIGSNVYDRLVLTIQFIVMNRQVALWVPPEVAIFGVLDILTKLSVSIYALLTVLSLISLFGSLLQESRWGQRLPVNGIVQALKLVAVLVGIILVASILLNRSPVILLSGLSAMTAVTMLVFKDPIMGFVSGIQLSAYNMLSVGDWLEMPKYNADGDVLEIGLSTVKVQNWDKTIVTVPTATLMTESFKNWRGMEQSGGRRIKRSVFIDITSIHFLTDAEYERLKRARLISGYLAEKADELKKYNQSLGVDMEPSINGRHLTNVGTFRAYLQSYLRSHSRIHKGLTMLVRQLAPTSEGLPIEVYVFTDTTAWAEYEAIQADIFDHVFAVLPEFGLRAYQAPSGNDMRVLAQAKE